jgi:methyl-accepting chemotaxis protein WspA
VKVNLRRKIYGLAALAAALPVLVMLALVLGFESRVTEVAGRELTELGQANVAQTARDVYGLCETANDLIQRKVNHDLAVARMVLAQRGRVAFGGDQVRWDAVEQVSGQVRTVSLPRMILGGVAASPNRSFQTAAPVVDEISRLVGSPSSIFQRMNEEGDMLRVASTVPAADAQRAIGTYVSASTGGAPNPVVSAILRGHTYRGTAYVVDNWYVAAYEPLRDAQGRVAGMLFVGEKLASVESLRRTIQNTTIGRSGYVCVIGAKGNLRGRYIISKDSRRDGENILDMRDAQGNAFVQRIIEKTTALERGGVYHDAYPWANPGDPRPRTKLAALVYFEPWDWLINASTYEDDYLTTIQGLRSTVGRLVWALVVGGVLVMLLALTAAMYMGQRLTRPLELVTRLAGKIAAGDLHGAKSELASLGERFHERGESGRFDFRDESHDLLDSFETMTGTLDKLIGQVQRSGIQVTTSATEIAASARQLEATVAEQAASTREVSATSTQISSTASALLETMNGVTQAVGEAATRAEGGHGELGRMEGSMRELVKATSTISSRLGVISDRASKISTVVTTINKVSDQTALLSLNAAIEAEKAGEFGKGFSVVAREISRLADQTAVATQDIEGVIKEMQSSVSSGVMEMDKFSEEVRRRVGDVNKVAEQLGGIIDRVRALGPEFESVQDGMHTQSIAAQQISEAMKQLSAAADQTKESLGEFKQATGQLNAAVQGLQGQVSQFKISA